MNENLMPQATETVLIFDFDGTIADTLSAGIEIYNEIAPSFRVSTVGPEDVAILRNLNSRALLDHLGISRLKALKLGAELRRQLHRRMDEVMPIDGIAAAIRELDESGYQLTILTSNSRDNVENFLERIGLKEAFQRIESGVSLFGKAKRIQKLLTSEGIPASSAIYIGDETRDMEASRSAQVPCIAVTWGVNGEQAMLTEDPQRCIGHPSELNAAVRSIVAGEE